MSTSPSKSSQKRPHSSLSSQTDDEEYSCPSPASSVSSGFSVLSHRSSTGSETDFEIVQELRNASLEEHEYEPARKRDRKTREMVKEFKAISEMLSEQKISSKSEKTAVEDLIGEVKELREDNGKLQKENEELKKKLESFRQAIFAPTLPIKTAICGTWRPCKSLNHLTFMSKMRESKIDELSIKIFQQGSLHFDLVDDNLSSYVIYDGEHLEHHKTHLGEVHRMFGYTRTTFHDPNQNSLVTIDHNTYEDRIMMKEVKQIKNGYLYVEQERFGMSCTRIYERAEDPQVAQIKTTVTGPWRLQYTVDRTRGRVDQSCKDQRVDRYQWRENTYTWHTASGLEFSKTLNSSVFLNVCEARTFVKDGKLTTSYRRTDLGDKEILRTERFVKQQKLNVVTVYSKTGEEFKSVYGKL